MTCKISTNEHSINLHKSEMDSGLDTKDQTVYLGDLKSIKDAHRNILQKQSARLEHEYVR